MKFGPLETEFEGMMEIFNVREGEPGSWYLHMFDVRLESGIILRNIKHCLSKKGHNYISFPSFKDDMGKYIPFVEFPVEDKRIIEKEWLDHFKNNKIARDVLEIDDMLGPSDIPF